MKIKFGEELKEYEVFTIFVVRKVISETVYEISYTNYQMLDENNSYMIEEVIFDCDAKYLSKSLQHIQMAAYYFKFERNDRYCILGDLDKVFKLKNKKYTLIYDKECGPI